MTDPTSPLSGWTTERSATPPPSIPVLGGPPAEPPRPRRRGLVVLVAALVVVGVGAGAAFALGGGGGDDDRAELAAAVARRLESSEGFTASDATCIAGDVADALHDDLEADDVTKGSVPPALEARFVRAVGDGVQACHVDLTATTATTAPLGTPTTLEPSADAIAAQVQQLTGFYQQNLGVDAAKAECIARTVVGWQIGPTAVPDGAQKPLTDALAACGIDPSEVHAPPG